MKKYLKVVITAVLVLSMVPSALAKGNIDTLVAQNQLKYAEEKDEVMDALENSKQKPKEVLVKYKDDLGRDELKDLTSINELKIKDSYKLLIADKPFAQALISGENLAASLNSMPHQWEFPITKMKGDSEIPAAACIVDFSENKWQVVEVGGRLTPDLSILSSKPNSISKLFKDKGLEEGDAFGHIRIHGLGIDVLYLTKDNQEYFIPLNLGNSEHYGLKSKELYSREQFVNAVGGPIKRGLENPSNLEGGSSIPKPTESSSSNNTAIIVLSALALGILATITYRKLIVKDM